MSTNYLNYLKLSCNKFAKQYDIFDIVLYGSFVKGKEEARDIDILIIFKDENLRKRSEIAQELKIVLRRKIENIDIKTINLSELFKGYFLARQAVLVEGFSLAYNQHLAERLGFKGYSLFSYNLKNLNHNEKTKFTYALIGRKKEGMIKKLKAEPLGRGAILVPIKDSTIFENFLERWKISFNKRQILVSLI